MNNLLAPPSPEPWKEVVQVRDSKGYTTWTSQWFPVRLSQSTPITHKYSSRAPALPARDHIS